ncbi:MAG: DUF4301 family protein [Bacteroidota bacterium]
MFTEKDLAQIAERGSALADVQTQVENFKQGFPFLQVLKAATVGDGIIRLSEEELAAHIVFYDQVLAEKKILKFVPASGAASRMFKALFACLSSFEAGEGDASSLAANDQLQSLGYFFHHLNDFAFSDELQQTIGNGSLSELVAEQKVVPILQALLNEEGLGYGKLPKGLLKFHSYPEGARTPAEEHLVEAVSYGAASGGTAYLHFTVSPEHMGKFQALISEKKPALEAASGVQIEVSYSIQKPATDTIAVDMANAPFRLSDDSILFRPGGHGALLENLNDLEADIMFIKNIDNVVPDSLKPETIRYKKALAGLLLQVQEQVFASLNKLDAEGAAVLSETEDFVKSTLACQLPEAYGSWSEADKMAYLRGKLHRPIRICGMVKNEGEPGGGPFWALNADGSVSLQIAESAQIDKDNADQMGIMQGATHFNPVDLVCAPRDKDGNSFDLLAFRDPQTGFIAYKSKDGKDLKAQELPGLWNGAMANWTTLFVEVPIITFNPVKTVNDLLRPQHQG